MMSGPLGMNPLQFGDPARNTIQSVPTKLFRKFEKARSWKHISRLVNNYDRENPASSGLFVPGDRLQ